MSAPLALGTDLGALILAGDADILGHLAEEAKAAALAAADATVVEERTNSRVYSRIEPELMDTIGSSNINENNNDILRSLDNQQTELEIGQKVKKSTDLLLTLKDIGATKGNTETGEDPLAAVLRSNSPEMGGTEIAEICGRMVEEASAAADENEPAVMSCNTQNYQNQQNGKGMATANLGISETNLNIPIELQDETEETPNIDVEEESDESGNVSNLVGPIPMPNPLHIGPSAFTGPGSILSYSPGGPSHLLNAALNYFVLGPGVNLLAPFAPLQAIDSVRDHQPIGPTIVHTGHDQEYKGPSSVVNSMGNLASSNGFADGPESVSNSDVPMSSLQAAKRDHQPNSQSPPNISPDWDRRWLRKRKVEEEQKIPLGWVIFPLVVDSLLEQVVARCKMDLNGKANMKAGIVDVLIYQKKMAQVAKNRQIGGESTLRHYCKDSKTMLEEYLGDDVANKPDFFKQFNNTFLVTFEEYQQALQLSGLQKKKKKNMKEEKEPKQKRMKKEPKQEKPIVEEKPASELTFEELRALYEQKLLENHGFKEPEVAIGKQQQPKQEKAKEKKEPKLEKAKEEKEAEEPAQEEANIVPPADANIVPPGNANIVPLGNANIGVPPADANIVPPADANIVPLGNANIGVPPADANIVPPANANIVVQPNANAVDGRAAAEALAKERSKRKRQRYRQNQKLLREGNGGGNGGNGGGPAGGNGGGPNGDGDGGGPVPV